MIPKLSFVQKQEQHLQQKLTHRFIESMNILQMSSEELYDYLEKESIDNPSIDVEFIINGYPRESSSTNNLDTKREYLYEVASNRAQTDSLETMLLSQLRINGITGKSYEIARFLIGNLDDNGFLTLTLEEACSYLHEEISGVEASLRLLQALEPAGVGARTLQECLEIQIKKDPNADTWACHFVTNYFKELANGKIQQVADKLKITKDQLRHSMAYIRNLNPRPGLKYSHQVIKYIQPDATLQKDHDQYHLILNEGYNITLNKSHQRLVDCKTKEEKYYKRKYMDSAQWLINSLQQRKMTLIMVIDAILDEQKDFLEKGVSFIKPMKLKTIAEKVQLDMSTISRVTSNKYIQTPHGIFELKFFFTNGLQTNMKEDTSSINIKERIRQLITEEHKSRPLSDQKITAALLKQGIQISRRTVMKYRDEMNILSSKLRNHT
jgi:RNA polymerase sigma-54 factor